MSIQMAMKFIQSVGIDESLKEMIRASIQEADLERLVRIGREAGYRFSSDELREAYKYDWKARWAFYCSGL